MLACSGETIFRLLFRRVLVRLTLLMARCPSKIFDLSSACKKLYVKLSHGPNALYWQYWTIFVTVDVAIHSGQKFAIVWENG